MRRLLALAALLAAAAASTGCLALATPAARAGEPAPEVEARLLSGEAWRLSDQRGKVVLLDVMGVSCSACRQQMPELLALHDAFRDDPAFEMVSLELGATFPGWGAESDAEMRAFSEEWGMPWEIAAATDASRLARDYRIVILPTLVVIDPEGRVHAQARGDRYSLEELKALVAGARA